LKTLIIGGGIGGLAAGIALRRADVDVEIFERAPEICEVGAGVALWANAIQALSELGLNDAIRRLSVPYRAGGLRCWNGRVLTSMSTTELQRKYGVVAVVAHRADLLAALIDALGRDRIRLGAHCTDVRDKDGAVTAVFADGRSATGDMLIGADGLHSVVRARLHGQQSPSYAGFTAWRGVVSFPAARVEAAESWGYGAIFGCVPISGDRVYWYATSNAPEGARATDEKAELLRVFSEWHDPIADLIRATNASDILRNDIYDRQPLAAWGRGRMTLLGDAAHPMTPNLGQGACQAIEDAVVLGRSVRECVDVPAALRQYESKRAARTSAIVRHSRQVSRIAQLANPLLVAVRNAVVARLSPAVQARALERVVGFRI
jgi:2-polyprenyl-6-methoxyphenol hydroxylase-like FAD-dependent oxidoreductase